MLSSVLHSERAVQVNIEIMRAFVRFRNTTATHQDLRRELLKLERKYEHHDKQIKVVFDAIRQLIEQPTKETPRIGFKTK